MAEKRHVKDEWYQINGIPTPKANLTLDKAKKLLAKCQVAESQEAIEKLVNEAK